MKRLVLLGLVCLFAWSCRQEPVAAPAPPETPADPPAQAETPEPPAVEVEPPEGHPRLPDDAGQYAPSLVRSDDVTAEDIERMRNTTLCATCHEGAARTWAESAHARSSFDNPYYRATVDAFREARGNQASRFCAGCHDPLLLLSGAIDEPVSPRDPLASAGITCLVCHGIENVRADGNASYDLRTTDPLFPDPGDEGSVARHRRRMASDSLRTAKLCGSCHRSFAGPAMGNPHHLLGIDDLGAWGTSAYGGSRGAILEGEIEARDCRGCHMKDVPAPRDMAAHDGMIASHGVPGAHLGLSRDPAQRAAVQQMLVGAATIDVAAARTGSEWSYPAETASSLLGDVSVDVVVRNQHVGHRFPGGTRDIQDTFIELVLLDAEGDVVASAGDAHGGEGLAPPVDPTAFRLRAVVLDEDGSPERRHFVHRFVAGGFDRTLGPRESLVVRYTGELPRAVRRVRARLYHRRHDRELAALACRATRRDRGYQRGRAIDGCAPPELTLVAEAEVSLRADATSGAGEANGETRGDSARPAWERLCDLGAARMRSLQEQLDEARPPLEAALELATAPFERAQVRSLLGRLAGKQGRTDEALAHLDAAEAVTGRHPAIDRGRGDALAQVWRFDEATAAYARVAEDSGTDTIAWRDLARAHGSAANNEDALTAATRGLALAPHHGGLLRTQSLAIPPEHPRYRIAREAFLDHRRHDQQPELLRACQERDEECRRDRAPIAVVPLRVH